jgi:hypothetical protein
MQLYIFEENIQKWQKTQQERHTEKLQTKISAKNK